MIQQKIKGSKSQVHLMIDPEVYKKVKAQAALKGKTLQDYIAEVLIQSITKGA